MRRALLLAPILATALALGGCGDDEAGGSLDEVIGYLPGNAPFAVAIETDPEGDQVEALDSILDKFPFGDSVKESLEEELEEEGIDYERDLEPLLGNPLVVGAPDAQSFVGQEKEFVAAIQAEDPDKLDELVEREGKEAGETGGAKVYEDKDGDYFAVEDDVLVLADSRDTLEAAVEQRDQDDRLTESRFDVALADLPEEALVRVFADLGALIESDPDTRDARKVEWVAALETLAATASVEEDEVTIDFEVATDSGELSDEDVPIATGRESPAVVRREGELAFGIRDPGKVIEFAQRAAQAADPTAFRQFDVAKRQIEGRAEVDIDRDLVAQLNGDLSVGVSLDGKLGARTELKDPRTLERALRRVARELPSIAGALDGGTLTGPRGRGGLYRFSEPDGDSVFFGVADDVFVLSDDAARARSLAGESPEAVPGVKGAGVLAGDAEEIANEVIARQDGISALGALFTGPLGDLTGSVEGDTEGLRGSLKLEID
jgi:hypothetical protein